MACRPKCSRGEKCIGNVCTDLAEAELISKQVFETDELRGDSKETSSKVKTSQSRDRGKNDR